MNLSGRLAASSLLSISCASLLFAGCSVGDPQGLASDGSPDDVGSSEQSIFEGTFESGHPEVVFLFNVSGGSCTATIIAPRVVLTARHCVTQGQTSQLASPSALRIYVGPNGQNPRAEYRASQIHAVPGAFDPDQPNDLALVVLSSSAAETPREISRQDPSALYGQVVTSVGYGQTDRGGAGTKYMTTTSVQGIRAGFVYVAPSVCSGDSGGPLIGPDGLVYGVASFIYDPGRTRQPICGDPGAYNELYRHINFINGVLESTGVCLEDAVEICNGEDDDCDDEVDEGCTALGAACADSSECVGGLCADTAAGRICTSVCDPLRPAQGCGAGFYCGGGQGTCGGHCLVGSAGANPVGADCGADTECASLLCVDPGDGRARCLQPCQGDAGLCLGGEVCAAGSGACGACVPQEIFGDGRGLGEACEDNCREELTCLAVREGDSGECAGPCGSGDTCEQGFVCREELCIRDRRQQVGGSCAENSDCLGGICAIQGEQAWCTSTCSSTVACPSGLDCVPVSGADICVPTLVLDGETCTSNPDCASGLCADIGAGSTCTSLCGSTEPCARGFSCERVADGSAAVCVAPPAEEPPGGCSVSAPGADHARGSWLLLALGLTLTLGRRRRRSVRASPKSSRD